METDTSEVGGEREDEDDEEPPLLPDDGTPRVTLRSSRDTQFHPWVYRRQVGAAPRGLAHGDEVVVVSSRGDPLGRGFWHGTSQIAVRLMTRDVMRKLNGGFLREKLEIAVSLRRDVLKLDKKTNAWRVVHGEGDGLSGLVVDRYDEMLVVQIFSRAFWERRRVVELLLLELFPGSHIVIRVDPSSARHEGIDTREQERLDEEGAWECEVRESKMRFLVSTAGHKTGFFIDQRENRERFAGFVRGKKVLDVCCYTGAFSIAARTLGKARRVVAVDLDENAIEQAKRNAELNHASIEFIHQDAFQFLRNQRHAAEPFEAIVVDPPKWATSRDRLDEAERRYVDINTYACRAIAPGGLLLTCSCSGLVSEEKFLRTLRHAAELARRDLEIIHIGGASPDHPVSVHCPESRYLKAVFARVR
jgi:23S rRNA (cytosine1962-C5)-methyltransferase